MIDVAIVGTGPVGAVAANLCGVHGLSAIAFEREHQVYDLPRAAVVYDDVQRILHGAGVLDAVLPTTSEMAGAEFLDASGKRIIGFDIPPGLRTANGYPPVLSINQPLLEQAIRSGLGSHPGVELRLGQEVVEFEQMPDHIELLVRDPASGATRRESARWLIGCDGATSGVRKLAAIAWRNLGYDCDWLVVDLELHRDVGLSQLCQQVCDADRPTTVLPLAGKLRRWEFQLKPGETVDEMQSHERVWSLLGRWLSPGDGVVLRAVVYRFHATIAETFRQRRLFLAGDAAHQTPPFQGQGLCTGIRDVGNLIWKLAMVRRGQATDNLLDSYTAERRPLAVAMVEHSTRTGQLIDAYAAMARGGAAPPVELQQYAYGGSQRLPDLAAGFLVPEGGDWVGRAVPQTRVLSPRGDGLLDDVVGPRWALVGRDDPRGLLGLEMRRLLEDLDVVAVTVPEPEGAMLGLLLAHQVVLVRPDRLVYGVAAATEVEALVRRLYEQFRSLDRVGLSRD